MFLTTFYCCLQVADSCNTNLKAAKLLKIPHIPCHNHLLHNEVNMWVSQNDTIRNTVASVEHTMKKVRQSNKNMAVLRKTCRLTPEIRNKTRWTGWGRMMRKYNRMRGDLITAHEDEDSSFTMNKTPAFKKRSEKINGTFTDINVVALSLQTRLYKLKCVRSDLDALLAESENGHTDPESCWYQRKLPGTYIKPGSGKLPDPHFVSGVIKLQNNQILQLTQDEKDSLSKVVTEEQGEGEEANEGDNVSFASRFKSRMKKRKAGVLEKSQASPYKNVDFICGSAAEVERLWSICKYILTNTRSRMTPSLFEALVYLKVNRDYWDSSSVQVAYTQALKESQSAKVQNMINEDDEFTELNADENV